ncbi:MAG: Asr1405/Asl0597 family protein [Halothece sp.]
MNQLTHPDALVTQVIKINRSDRWFVYRRLQELNMSCCCPDDGSLWVEIQTTVEAHLLRSTIQQFVSSRHDLAAWLERCWSTSILSISNT